MLLEKEFPPDERVEKEINTLRNQGHTVHLACITRSKKNILEEEEKGIHRMYVNNWMYKLSALILLVPFYLNKWKKFIRKLHSTYHYEAVHVHDLPLSAAGSYLKSNYGLKLVCDQHEYYSNWIVKTAHYNKGLGYLVKWFSHWKRYERKSLHAADLIITVEEPLKKQYLEEYGLPECKLISIPNTPDRALFQPDISGSNVFDRFKNQFVLLYFGGIDILRGIDKVIDTLPALKTAIPHVKFVLAGRIYGGFNPNKYAERKGVSEQVEFIGWVKPEQLPSLISVSDLGVFTPPSDRLEINKTIATKNYQFLVMNKPVMVGRASYMREFTERNGIGFSVDENDPVDIANHVKTYYHDQEIRKKMVSNCKKIAPFYYWDETSKPLVNKYSELETN